MIEVLLKITTAFFLTCLSLVVLGLDLGLNRHHITCDRERIVFTSKYGVITNGNDYNKDSHCEWLIKAAHEYSSITLTFTKMDTECSYDHVFIYDGESYTSPLLGSFSGNTTPPSVTATHGSMLILLYSDTNYVRKGFEAVFHVTDCPLNCSNNGVCQNHQCLCQPFWSGNACEINLCPNDCGSFDGRGECDSNGSNPVQCKCKSGYSGKDCSLPDSNKNSGNTWHLVSSSGFSARAGHTGIYIEKTDSFYVFGGYTFQKVLGDTLVYSFERNQWESVPTAISPSARHAHTAVSYFDNIIIFGGETENGSLSNELWFFNTTSLIWKPFDLESNFIPPPLARHSATLVDSHWMYIIGGSLPDDTLSTKLYRINIHKKKWEIVETYGYKDSYRRLVGHSAVYYEPTRTIFVFGGITAEYSHVSKLSNVMHAFHVDKKYWIKVKYEKNIFTPLERAFHTAAIIGDYMVIYGGYSHKHGDAEICYSNDTHLYHLQCHKWIDFSTLKGDFIGTRNPISQGVFSHAMAVRRGHTLLISGGYSGHMRSEFLAYVMPYVVYSDQPAVNPCSRHKRKENCEDNLACGWCVENDLCIERKSSKSCSKFSAETCPGLCSSLNDCLSCMIWGQPSIQNDISDRQDQFLSVPCAWCVQDFKCHAVNDGDTSCSSSNLSISNSSSGSRSNGWWGPKGTDIISLKECYIKDSPPGLISVQYRYPVNWSLPDDVTYLLKASEELYFRTEMQRNDTNGVEENAVKFIGFLHPMNAKPLSERVKNLNLAVCSAGSSAIFKLSTDSSSYHLENVASHGPRPSYDCLDAQRARGAPLFPYANAGQKYMFEFTVKIPTHYNATSKVELVWTAFSVQPEVIQQNYLELYKNGSCDTLTNCLSCLTDTLCGWCESTGTCYLKTNSDTVCQNSDGNSFLVTQPSSCTLCSDYMYCEQCTQAPFCEWLAEIALCVRKGRYKIAIKEPIFCPMPCYLRTSCTSCLGDPGVCAWCESTRTCFPFSVYTSIYSYGKCRDWVDENRVETGDPTLLCRNCSRHTNCSTCIKDLTCGWCSYDKHPFEGLCIDGDFSGPYAGVCPTLFKNATTEVSDSQWLYGNCPDLDECYWGLHNCHKNSTCRNTPESYACECNIGFEGDGRECTRACAVKCIHGYCSDAPDYKCICDLGWTGEDCNTNCGCNNHSTCQHGIGICDECQNWTEGQFCEKCRAGSYAFTQEPKGCQKCSCNDHGNSELGYCNATTGVCFCLNNTMGPNCDKCIEGYYGDPRQNGECFEMCSPRKVITNATGGKFGSPAGSHPVQDCLWLLTVHPVLDMQSLLGPMESTDSYLQISIYKDMHIPCPHNHVYIYDGLPDFVASGHPNVLLGAFCGSNLSQPIIATAVSGYLTVHFKRDSIKHGFNASYVRLQQEAMNDSTEYCLENVTLEENVTICMRNYCPKDCSNYLNQGKCDKVYHTCVCEKEFAGEDCSVKLKSHNLVWSTVYNYKNVDLNVSSTNLPSGRTGHCLLSVRNKLTGIEDLWLFGGYSTTFGYLDDLFYFNTSSRQWIEVFSDNTPSPRLFHAAAALNGSLFIFGGLDKQITLSDFWEFSTSNQTWIELPEISTSSGSVPLAGSTLTAVNDNKLLLIGGFSPSYGFFEKVMEFDIENKQWSVINTTGAMPIGLYGHTTVYHSLTESIYVFGGVSYDTEHVAPSSFLYAFHYPSSQWFRLPPDNKVNAVKSRPLPRYFHSSIVKENYLVVIGGQGNRSLKDSQPFAYVFSCNLWIPLKDIAIETIGKWPEPIVGAAMAIANDDIYLFGNSDGQLSKLLLPPDICLLFSSNRVACIQQTGCAFCSLSDNGKNQTICYDQSKHAESRCYNPKESKQFFSVTCNAEWLEKRDCHQYTSCTDCVASWPYYTSARQMCRWCNNCQTGSCVPVESACSDEKDCTIQRGLIKDPFLCPMRECSASDCEKCGALGKCIWTRQVHRSGGYAHTLNKNPIYNWVCVMKEIQSASSFPIESMPPLECLKGCQQYTNCTSCLQSQGGEGGWHQCVWSETKQICMSPTFELLRCEDGSCGPVLRDNKSLCPAPCWQHFQASHCLSQANCGWCAFSGPKVDGRGLCMNGGIMGPTGGICRENQVILLGLPLPSQTVQWYQLSEGPPFWTYLTKPPENECENGHHNCDDAHEECVDTLEAYECRCKPGYKMIGKHCTPTCKQGCVNGTCVQPDVCQCNFGYVSQNCSIMCKCNGHSHCPGVDQLDMCLKCMNNTMGSHCEKCKPLFVGNPANGGKCVSCFDYCYTHSSTCVSNDLLNSTFTQTYNQSFVLELREKMTEGPLDEAVCIGCGNHTEGKRCDQCISGFFKAGENLEDGCRPCECHGHGDTCNPLNGENCNCQNNTENDRQCSQKNMKNIMHLTPCWQLQCSKCKEYFLGSPSHGHQCYRHMFLDKDYCFNPGTIEECNRNPSPLLQGHTGFFAVQPRYMNVDIRIIVDVTKGGVDFFLSAKEDAFIVEVDKETGLHHIYIDEKYGIDLKSFDMTADVNSVMKRRKRNSEDLSKESSNLTETVPVEVLLPTVANAQGLTTYIEVKKCEDFLLVRNLENRLVVTIPQEVHDLRTTRFYMILRGAGEETYGNLFFRQDQTRIDLFVFFSVFFSCFFLFLAICVVVWKVKQAFDLRRARRLHAAEMKHMASRPFGRIITVVDDDVEDSDLFLYSPCNYRKKLKHMKVHGRDSPKQIEDKLCLRPLAVEPLSDGFGAIATILVQLPGGAQSLVRMSLASSLITARSSPYHLGFGLRAAMRRRTSHANV